MNIEKFSQVASKIHFRISEHRLAIRFMILSRPLNLFTILSILPFFIGFYDFLNQNKQLKKTLFQKNIPIFDIPTESLNWDTFRYFSETKKDFFLGIEKVQWSPNSLILTKTLNTELFHQDYFVANLDKTPVSMNWYQKNQFSNSVDFPYLEELDNITDTQNFGSNRFYLNSFNGQTNLVLSKKLCFLEPVQKNQVFWTKTKNFSNLLQTFYLKLDEIPLKLDNLTSFPKAIEQDFLFLFETDKNLLKPINITFQEKKWKKQINDVSFSDFLSKKLCFLEQQTTKKYEKINSFNEGLKKTKSIQFVIEPGNFLQSQTKINEESIKKQLPAVSKFNSIENFSPLSTKDGFKNEKFLSYKSSLKKYNLEKVLTRFDFSSLFSFPLSNEIIEKSLNISNVLFEKQQHIEKLQTQIDLVLLEKRDSISRRMSGYYYPDMTSTQVSRYLLHNVYSCFAQSFGVWDTNQKNFKINLPANPAFLSLANQKVPQTDLSNLKITEFSLTRTLNIQDDDLNCYFYKDPIWLLKFKNQLTINSNSTRDYYYSPEIIPITTKEPLSSLYGEFFNQDFNSITYKKLISIFNKPQFFEKHFSDSWEPLTFRSWLIVSQVGFAFLIFQFLKSLFTEYFKELLWFIMDFLVNTNMIDENLKQEIDLLTGKKQKGFRLISKTTKKFQHIAGIKNLLPEIAEIVWYLRNRGKEFSLTKNFPRGLLLIGPPGTGKTVLVQAIAGEAEVPVLVLSGSSLVAPGESGALKLELLFQEARQLAPCIIFIDEIDTLAQKRQGVMQNPMGGDEILSALEPVNPSVDFAQSTNQDFRTNSQTSFFKKTDQIASLAANANDSGEFLNSSPYQKIALEIKQQIHAQEQFRQEQLTLLMQLLIELDGIQGRKGVVVIGATNRPEMLDSAIIRPGRFDKLVELGVPSYEKRLEILKLYGGILGTDPTISWEYFAQRTVGFTAADLASIMNQSCIKAILDNTKHNLKTIEHGIDRITTSEIEKPSKKVTNLFINRVAYYQAGKVLLSTILENHPPTLVSYLWPRRQNRRSLQILTNLQKYFFQCARRCELEDRIIGCYGGKAAEFLFLQNSSASASSFGLEDLSFAFVLICFTIEKWYLYSKSTLLSNLTQIISNKNSQELIPEKIEFFKELAYSMELSPHLLYSQETDISTHPLSQNFFSNAWWQFNISQELEFVERNLADWYRLYLPNPEETELNIEWSPPDEFYHRNLLNKQVNKNSSVTWNDLYKIARDYQVHAFVLESFNKALCLIDDNREFLDKLVFELLKTEVLRQPEIEKITSSFKSFTNITSPSNTPEESMQKLENLSPKEVENVSDIKILNNAFGQMSRRKIRNWIDLKLFKN